MTGCRAETHTDTSGRTAVLPPGTGKAAPEHKSHSASSLFQPGKKKEELLEQKSEDMKEIKMIWEENHLFVHFNVQPIGHFIVL